MEVADISNKGSTSSLSGVRAHDALRIGEQYHASLQRKFNKIQFHTQAFLRNCPSTSQ